MNGTAKGIAKNLAPALAFVAIAFSLTACLDPIPGGQMHILGDTTHTTFEGNSDVKDGKYAELKGGLTIEEGFGGVIEIDVGEPDKKSGLVDGHDYPEVTSSDLNLTKVADSKDKQWLVSVSRRTDGTLATEGSITVAHSDYTGSLTIPVRIKAQDGAGAKEDPPAWPYGNVQSTSSATTSSGGSTSSGGEGGSGS